jgi:hypothetical protein
MIIVNNVTVTGILHLGHGSQFFWLPIRACVQSANAPLEQSVIKNSLGVWPSGKRRSCFCAGSCQALLCQQRQGIAGARGQSGISPSDIHKPGVSFCPSAEVPSFVYIRAWVALRHIGTRPKATFFVAHVLPVVFLCQTPGN